MYRIITINDTVRVPPKEFGKDLSVTVLGILRNKYECKWDADIGYLLVVKSVRKVNVGRVIPGDGAAYHDVDFEMLIYTPKIFEIVQGEIVEILEFGAFMRLGPMDGLVHVSQITNDFINFDKKNRTLTGKESKHILKEKDLCMARIITLSSKSDVTKIGLTMRQSGLGKLEWIQEEKQQGEA
ncbi:MAG: DNA-directed RNA polymerase [Candidatus Methanofastidiosa archaeon]|jgi:DNA-directed RNA polymerase subunit E'|nr:DNA-directed RNA polymerase [Candidatus Methanofastidiosa archaeon]MDD4281971.1 DNA-directed RNA polymerase [Candidatus Methanofastidiosa archaeon]